MLGPLQPLPPPDLRASASGRRARRRRSTHGPLGLVCLLAVALGPDLPAAGSEDSSPFATRLHDIRGRIVQVWPLRVSRCDDGSGDLLILSSEGGPPTQKRFATWLPCGSALSPGDSRIRVRPIADAAVIVDVASIPGRTGPQLLSVSAAGLRIESLDGPPSPLDRPIPGGLPLPPRPWEIGRLPLVEAWNDDGKPMALVPSLTGAWLVDLASGDARRIEMPIYASYESFMPYLPETVWKWLVQEVSWPTLARADDDGDGRRDLFALSRWGIWIYHAGPAGLPSSPSRRLEYRALRRKNRTPPRSECTQLLRPRPRRRHPRRSGSEHDPGRLDGRPLDDPHPSQCGTGSKIDGPPTALREISGGFAGVDFVDLEGDGVMEVLETSFEFGVVAAHAAARDPARGDDRTDPRPRPDGPGRSAHALRRSAVLRPRLQGGPLRRTSCPDSETGTATDSSTCSLPAVTTRSAFAWEAAQRALRGCGAIVGRQPVPLASGASRIADLDGDGLDEIVAYSTSEPEPPLVVLENLGRLPGQPEQPAPALGA